MSTSVTDVISRKGIYDLIESGQVFRQGHHYIIENGADAYMLLRAGDKYPYVFLNTIADGDATIEILGAPTVTDQGDEEPSGNFNFNSDRVSLSKWYITPTLATEGFHIATTAILGGSGVGTPAGSKSSTTMSDFDVILVPNMDFLFKFTNTAGRDIQFLFECVYRERDRDFS